MLLQRPPHPRGAWRQAPRPPTKSRIPGRPRQITSGTRQRTILAFPGTNGPVFAPEKEMFPPAATSGGLHLPTHPKVPNQQRQQKRRKAMRAVSWRPTSESSCSATRAVELQEVQLGVLAVLRGGQPELTPEPEQHRVSEPAPQPPQHKRTSKPAPISPRRKLNDPVPEHVISDEPTPEPEQSDVSRDLQSALLLYYSTALYALWI
jgi:hypothetical protein